MALHQNLHQVQSRNPKPSSNFTPNLAFFNRIKNQSDFPIVSKDDHLPGSGVPSMTDGSSRTSSVCSASENASIPRDGSNSDKPYHCRRSSETDSVWSRQLDDHSYQQRRAQSPCSSIVSRVPRVSSPLSFNSDHDWYVKGCGAGHMIANEGNSPRKLEDFNTGSEIKDQKTQNNTTLALEANIDGSKAVAGTLGSDSESSASGSDFEEDSDDDSDFDDDDWSGADNYFEATIFQAVYPNVELAAHLITNLYSMMYPASSSKVSRKVSSWRARIYTSATDSRTTSTEKAPPSESNTTSSTSKIDSSKRDRLSGSPGKSNGEDGEEEDDDTDESKRKRFKDNDIGSGLALHIQKLACPFFKLNPAKYSVQLNLEGKVNDKQYRICAGPGFRTIQLLKEHLKRKHSPVQCDRCYLIFKAKGKDRAADVLELERHRQLDERCPRNSPEMKEGISEVQWANMDEKRLNKKGKSSNLEEPKSDVERWMDIWRVLFPELTPPTTPWYETFSIDACISRPSSGLSSYLQVHEQTVAYMLSDIKDACNRSEEELKSVLQRAAQAAFQVWSSTLQWNENSTTSFSSPFESDPSGSWQHISRCEPGIQNSLPAVSAVQSNIEREMTQSVPGTSNSFPMVRKGSANTPHNTPQMSYPTHNTPAMGQDAMGLAGNFDLVADPRGLGAELNTFSHNGYNANLPGIGDGSWPNNLQPIQFSNSNASYETVHIPSGGIQNPFNAEVIPTHVPPNLSDPRWGDQYTHRTFGQYGRDH